MIFVKGLQEIQIVLTKYNNMVILKVSKSSSVFSYIILLFVSGLPIFKGSLLSWSLYFQEAKNVLYKV